jgi:heptosyltransferase-2
MPQHLEPITPTAIKHRRILVRGVNWLGDAVMTTPAILRLREALPDADIVLLIHEKLGELFRDHPGVDLTLTFGDDTTFWQLIRRLRRERFDTALVLPNSFRSALEVRLAGIPRRIGRGGSHREWLLTEIVPDRTGIVSLKKKSRAEIQRAIQGPRISPPSLPPGSHHIHHYLHLAAALGASPEPVAPRVVVTGESIARVRKRLGLNGGPEGPVLFGLNAGAEYGPAKRWPRERFVAAAIEIQRRTGCRWLIFGGPGDAPLTNEINAELDFALHEARSPSSVSPMNLAGLTNLRELCALFKCCRVILTNDTGPMHVAAAVGTPVVVPFGSTSPQFTGPGLPGDGRHRLLSSDAPCSPCFLRECPIDFRCMKEITVEQVVEAVIKTAAATC